MPPPDSTETTIAAALRAAGCVFAEEEARLLRAEAVTPARLAAMVERRAEGAPLEQVLGWAELRGTRVRLEAGVFVPRVRSELLVDEGRALAGPDSIVVDLCCGSGAIGVAVVAAAEEAELHAVDIDPVAVNCARSNMPAGGRAYLGDLFGPLPPRLRGAVGLVLANAPYVPSREIPLLPREARLNEPRAALDGGPDGLAIQRRLITAAPEWLAPGGHLLIETSEAQAQGTADACAGSGLTTRLARDEELDATVVVATAARR